METKLTQKLISIQSRLVAPKGQLNKFGNYKYRSCEDILEAVKPLLKESGIALIIHDEIVQLGDRFYIKAIAEISDGENTISVQAFAREALVKKGMDESQITAATSSYARKCALNGLFCIDDTKDADSTNKHNGNGSSEKISEKELSDLLDMINSVDSTEAKVLAYMKLDKLEDMPKSEYKKAMTALESKGKK